MMNKILSTLFVMFAFATITLAQIKVVAPNGDVGIGVDNPTEKLEVDGNVKINGEEINEGFQCVKTGGSASALFNRTDKAAMSLGGGFFGSGVIYDSLYFFQIKWHLLNKG